VRARPLLETDLDPDPLAQFHAWHADAEAAGVRLPDAMALATTGPDGAPSLRMLLLKDARQDGFAFYTNYGSRKARELEANPLGALLFYWDPLGRQVRVEGPVERVPDEESAAYFETRPRGSQLAAWASRQSEPLASRDVLEDDVRRLASRFDGTAVERPPHWGGYRLVPARYEFWQHRDDRLHDRIRYEQDPAGDGWIRTRLAP
jgi:pyridoxamine 5'-phosphate oxidase